MAQTDWLADRFEEQRQHMRSVALRILGSTAEADDAVQETWLRLSRSDADGIQNLAGWLTTVIARVSLDMLRSRASRREDAADTMVVDAVEHGDSGGDPEYEAMLADSLGPALLVVLGKLAPGERLAFVLHDMFAVPFEEIGSILGRSPNAAKQLASRARARIRGSELNPGTNPAREREVVEAFLAASRGGNFDALLAVLDPDVVLHADPAAVQMGGPGELVGAAAVAGSFFGRAAGAEAALVDGRAGFVWAPGGRPRVVWEVTIDGGKIVDIYMIAAAHTLDELELMVSDS
ncbi:MAG TPA: sigma-70 family RNA polymerase sigma factor [Ilumatobacteraceae bacterium]